MILRNLFLIFLKHIRATTTWTTRFDALVWGELKVLKHLYTFTIDQFWMSATERLVMHCSSILSINQVRFSITISMVQQCSMHLRWEPLLGLRCQEQGDKEDKESNLGNSIIYRNHEEESNLHLLSNRSPPLE